MTSSTPSPHADDRSASGARLGRLAEAVMQSLAEAVTVNDPSGQIVYANEAAVELLRADGVEDLLRSPPQEIMARFAVYDDAGRPLDLADMPSARILAGETRAEPILVRTVVLATGEERWLLNKISTLRDTDGAVVRVVNVIEDVTEVKRAERAQRLIARTLQHGLAPPRLPDMPGWSAAVLCRPAGELNEVGGDFYDVFPGLGGDWMLVLGDVAGQGAEAATQTSLARFTVRTAAELTGDVSRAVARLDDTLRSQAGLPLCTVVCASLAERGNGTARLTLASAGHPPPLLVRGHSVRPVGHPGTIAGAFEGEHWPTDTVELERGDVLVLYTDGVLDAQGEDDRFGEARLREALTTDGGTAEERLAALDGRLRAFQRGAQTDDTTILILEYLD